MDSDKQQPVVMTRKRRYPIRFLVTAIVVLVLGAAAAMALATRHKPVSAVQVHRQLSQSVSAAIGRSDGLTTSFDAKTGLATVVQMDKVDIPELSADNVRTAYVLLVRLGNKMFAIDGVKSIQVTEKTQFTPPQDPRLANVPPKLRPKAPPVVTMDVVTIAMTKTNFQSVNWINYKGQPINKLITAKSYEYVINPMLIPQLKDSDLYLDLK